MAVIAIHELQLLPWRYQVLDKLVISCLDILLQGPG